MEALRRAAYLWVAIACACTAFFAWLYYELYWRWRALFNSEGRYFDEDDMVVHHQQNEVLIIPLLVCVIWFSVALWFAARKPRPK